MGRRMLGAWVLVLVACNSSSGRDDLPTTMPGTLSNVDSGEPTTGMTTTPTGSGGTSSSGSGEPGSSSEAVDSSGSSAASSSGDSGAVFDLGTPADMGIDPSLPKPQLWYSVEDLLVYIELKQTDGTVAQLVTSKIMPNPSLAGPVNSCALTMLDDGSLLGARGIAGNTRLFHIPDPPKDGSDVKVTILGAMPGKLYIEAMHTDCDGRVYLIDTGSDGSNSDGNRLLRFTGDYLAKDFKYDVISDLMVAVAADIDDMAPGIDAQGMVIDNPGFALDSGSVYNLDYTDGSGTLVGMAGTYAIHALGGQLFTDKKSRLYVMDIDAQVFEADPKTLALSPVLTTGPKLMSGNKPGNTGFAGPLTNCRSGFPPG